MTFSHFNRRLHLYLGTALLPWFFMYGVSSIPFAHNAWFAQKGGPRFSPRFDRSYSIDIPEGAELRPIAERILRDAGMEGAFGVNRDKAGNLRIYRFDFRNVSNVVYYPNEKRLVAQDREFRWNYFLTGMHARGGFEQPAFLNKAWGVLVDVVSLGLLLWIASGVYMWWHVRGHRLWGAAALACGVLSFAVFLLAL